MNETIQLATKRDIKKIKDFLNRAEVSTVGVEENIEHFVLLKDEAQQLIATLGFERDGHSGLLRSLVISPGLSQSDILALFKSAVQAAKRKGIRKLYLATNKKTSVALFEMLHFQQTDYVLLPEKLREHSHLAHIEDVDNLRVMCYEMPEC